jgi:hypothetical protein
MPELGRRAGKKIRKELYGQRARESFAAWLAEYGRLIVFAARVRRLDALRSGG